MAAWPAQARSMVIIGLTALVVSSELGLYSEWKSKLSAKALAYLAHPQEVWQTVSFAQFTMLLVVWMLLSATGWYMYRLIVDRYTDQKPHPQLRPCLPHFGWSRLCFWVRAVACRLSR